MQDQDIISEEERNEAAPVRHFWRNVAIMLAILVVYFLVMAAISAESIEWMLKGGAL